MHTSRRTWLTGVLAAALLAGCAVTPPPAPAPTPQVRAALAPTGKLRVGVYPGSPISQLDKAGGKTGVAYELGRELARWLDVPFEPLEYRTEEDVFEALQAMEVDVTFTRASDERARDVNFTLPLLNLERGYLVASGSKLREVAEVDRAGVKVGVVPGSPAQAVLARAYRHAQLVPVASPKAAAALLAQRKIDAFAAGKDILYTLADDMSGARVLDGRWGLEPLALALPKGRQAGLSYLSRFALTVRRDGTLDSAVDRAGLRGTFEPSVR